MYSSLEIWPTSSNPASFIPVVVSFYPFENYQNLEVFDKPFECCPNCKRTVDKSTTRDGDKCKCGWCSKVFKPHDFGNSSSSNSINPNLVNNSPNTFAITQNNYNPEKYHQVPSNSTTRFNIDKQMQNDSMVSRRPPKQKYNYVLVFALDACSPPDQLNKLKRYILIAIESLPKTQPFLLSVIRKRFISYIIVIDGNSIVFEIPHSQKVWQLFNIQKSANYSTPDRIEALKKYIKSIDSENDSSKHFVNRLIFQLSGKNTLFSEIVLFSSKGPSKTEKRQIFVNWVSPKNRIKKRPCIDGFFVCEDFPNPEEQIRYMIEKISKSPAIFNVKINAYVTNYKCQTDPVEFATAKENFSQAFRLTPVKFSSNISPSIFGVEMSYIKFNKKFTGIVEENDDENGDTQKEERNCSFFYEVYKETIWNSKVFKKSTDFIPVISGVNPFLLIPHIYGNQTFYENFLKNLYENYSQHCNASLAGDSDDFTFSTVPELQWFPRVLLDKISSKLEIRQLQKINLSSIENIDNERGNDQDEISKNDFTQNSNNTLNVESSNNSIQQKEEENDGNLNIVVNLNSPILPISCNIMENFARFYPAMSFWESPNVLIAENCPFDGYFYELVSYPKIVVIDTILHILVFAEFLEIPLNSKLYEYINKRIMNRFPKAAIKIIPIETLSSLFPEENSLFEAVSKFVKKTKIANMFKSI
ncbi:hypothetical protein TRFO_19468 [Tritrichomonas foetus]|uniref:Protein transport protein SEC23 n=1 Tax=Tritrichomonas foetus TaxID=1144522 RepID=A0A1J4KMX7_9EUKA|nr:hypothetical protein TRFO_19468 [Tritrichomonas foetus]|eukprot:OHT11054.1 hypothetical protein TRFO_19468 [Tritrichomonas foetus]